jgi:hypothetical protein
MVEHLEIEPPAIGGRTEVNMFYLSCLGFKALRR